MISFTSARMSPPRLRARSAIRSYSLTSAPSRARREVAAAKRAPFAISLDDGVAECLREGASPARLRYFNNASLVDRIDGHWSPVRPGSAGRLERDAAFAHVTGGTGRVAVAVEALEFVGGDLSVLQDVIQHGPRALCGDALDHLPEFGVHVRESSHDILALFGGPVSGEFLGSRPSFWADRV